MPNGIWTKETFLMDVPQDDQKMMAMTHDLLKDLKEQLNSIDVNIDIIRKEQPGLCAKVMDEKITLNNKLRRKFNLGQGGGAGILGAVILKGIEFLSK